MTTPLITPEAAISTVEAMFKWIYDSPIPYPPEEQRMRLSTIANIVIDACHGAIVNQPLHDAYAKCKAVRGIK